MTEFARRVSGWLAVLGAVVLVAQPVEAQAGRTGAKRPPLPPVELPCESPTALDTRLGVDTLASVFSALITPDGRRSCQLFGDESRNYFLVTQRGVIRGSAYEFREDGTGWVAVTPGSPVHVWMADAVWQIDCKIDKIDDSRSCYTRRGELWIFRGSIGYWISIGGNHYPGSVVTLRIDGRPALTAPAKAGFSKGAATQALGQLRGGKLARTRYQEWPYDENIDGEVALAGIAAALDLMELAYVALGSPN